MCSIEEIQTFVPVIVNTLASAINPRTVLYDKVDEPRVILFEESTDRSVIGYDEVTSPGWFCMTSSLLSINACIADGDRVWGRDNPCCFPACLNKFKSDSAEDHDPQTGCLRHLNEFTDNNGTLKACCGTGGPYNSKVSAVCASGFEHVCSDPSTYVCWMEFTPLKRQINLSPTE
ncbi:hypothetical protein ACLOJK_010475 [Asimina triloba]